MQQNIDSFDANGLDTFATFLASKGILTGLIGVGGATAEASGLINITWTDNSGSGDALADDELVAVWYNETQDYWKFAKPPVGNRNVEAVAMADADILENDEVHVYVFLARPDVSKISDTTYKMLVAGA